jgi:hypothetical protein
MCDNFDAVMLYTYKKENGDMACSGCDKPPPDKFFDICRLLLLKNSYILPYMEEEARKRRKHKQFIIWALNA